MINLLNTTSLGAHPGLMHADSLINTDFPAFDGHHGVQDPPPPPLVIKGDDYMNVLQAVDSDRSVVIHGYGGADILAGGHAADTLLGGDGDDTLLMGNNDYGVGGAGTDCFVFNLNNADNDHYTVKIDGNDVLLVVTQDFDDLHYSMLPDGSGVRVTDDHGHAMTIQGENIDLDQFFATPAPPPASPDFHV